MGMAALILLKRGIRLLAMLSALSVLTSPAQAEQYQLELSLLGGEDDITLMGVEDNSSVWFGVREDQIVEDLRLSLRLSHSDALIAELSNLTVYLNDQMVRTVLLDHRAGISAEKTYEFVLPAAQLKPMNELRFHQVAHYTRECEDPLHASLWTELQAQSSLDFTVRAKALPNELSLLPVPFFDTNDPRRQRITLVMPKSSQENVQAAGILASWFGALSGHRGIDIQVEKQLPATGAVIAVGTQADLAVLGIRSTGNGASLQLLDAPHGGIEKMLVVAGQSAADVVVAARAAALGGDFLSGPEAIDIKVDVQARQAYDAPNWLPTDKPVKFGDIIDTQALTTYGYKPSPIHMHLRLPPDLYAWRRGRVPMTLKYRPARNVSDADAYLSAYIGDAQLKTLWFNQGDAELDSLFGNDTLPLVEKDIMIPLSALSTRATLSFRFYYPTPTFNECENLLADNVRSAVDPDSSLDLTGMMHHLAMPNMGVFFDAGYPFSRMADLSETAVLLQANDSDVNTFLMLMARIGQSTGYPATEVQVYLDPKTSQGLEDKDLLLLAGGGGLALLDQWQKYLPSAAQNLRGAQTVLTGFRSPLSRLRHVVVVKGTDSRVVEQNITELLSQANLGSAVQGSVVSTTGSKVEVVSTKTTYYTGHLGWWRGLQFFLGERPWLLALLFIMGISLASLVAYIGLRARARSRLRATSAAGQ